MQNSNAVIQLNGSDNTCQLCRVKNLCLSSTLNISERNKFSTITIHNKLLSRGEHLFLPGDPFHFVHIIHSGSVKTYVESKDGDMQITGFYFQGDILGLDGFSGGVHGCGAVALETVTVCKIPLAEFEKMVGQNPVLHHEFINVMSREIIFKQFILLVLGKMTAEQRVTDFIVHISEKCGVLGYSSVVFNLSMSRAEIANYLGLAVETVSRVFTDLKNRGLISVERRKVTIENSEGIKSLPKYRDIENGVKAGA